MYEGRKQWIQVLLVEKNLPLGDLMLKNPITSYPKRFFIACSNIFWSAMWLTSIGLTLLYPIRWLSGDTMDLVRAVSYVMPWLIIFSLIMSIIAGLTHRSRLALALAIPAVLIGFTFAPLFLPNHKTIPPP